MIAKLDMQGSKIEETNIFPINPLNRNILICGTSGTGKSRLLKEIEKIQAPYLKIIFKNDSEKAFSIAKNRVFIEKDKTNFLDSWNETIQADNQGYMLIQQQIAIQELRKENQSLQELFKEIKERLKDAEKIDRPAIQLILSRLKTLYPNQSKELHASGKISMEGLSEEEYQFFSDYILRNAYEILIDQIISIDEIHRIKPLYDGIISRIAREIRSRGALMATTQSLSDLPPSLINNFSTIYQFQTIDRNDLDYLKLISEPLKDDILNLEDHEFVEIRSYPKLRKQGLQYKMKLI